MISHQDQRQRRAVALFEVDERVLVDPVDRRERRALRAAGGHDVELVEREHRADRADQRRQQQRAQHQRQGDQPHALPVAGAVDQRGLVDVDADRLDRGQQQDHAEADDLPGDGENDRPQRQVGVDEPDDRVGDDVQVLQQPVEQADLLVEQPVPQQARTAEADHHRQEHRGARQPRRAPGLGREQCQQQAEAHQDRRDVHGVFDGEPQRLPRRGIVERADVVAKADERTAAEQRGVGQRQPRQPAERIQHERSHEQQRGRQVEQACGAAPRLPHRQSLAIAFIFCFAAAIAASTLPSNTADWIIWIHGL